MRFARDTANESKHCRRASSASSKSECGSAQSEEVNRSQRLYRKAHSEELNRKRREYRRTHAAEENRKQREYRQRGALERETPQQPTAEESARKWLEYRESHGPGPT